MAGFDKPPLPLDQQLAKLQQRGLIIPCLDRARHYLANISYYRLSAYTRPFYDLNHSEHRFLAGTTFDQVLALYIFDRELRLLLLDAIERIEVALRAQITNTLAEHYGDAHSYTDPSIFDDRYNHAWLMEKLNKEVASREAEAFVAHYRIRYEAAPKQPPIWMAMELLTFKEVSILFGALRNTPDTDRISRHFGWPHTLLCSWFRSLSDLRNHCAHHARIWNREFGSFPKLPRKPPKDWVQIPEWIAKAQSERGWSIAPQRRLYMQLVVIETLMRSVCPESVWSQRLLHFLDQHPNVSHFAMGFPDNWITQKFWQPALTAINTPKEPRNEPI